MESGVQLVIEICGGTQVEVQAALGESVGELRPRVAAELGNAEGVGLVLLCGARALLTPTWFRSCQAAI